jgi:hypothetical protein
MTVPLKKGKQEEGCGRELVGRGGRGLEIAEKEKERLAPRGG